MFLPKIKNEDLPEEVKKLLGDADAEFDSIVDMSDIMDINLDPDAYFEQRHATANALIEARKVLEDLRQKEKKSKKPKD